MTERGVEMKKRIEVVGAVLTYEGKIFAAQRGPGRSMENYWEFPGGKIEEGESPREALARELREELKLDAEIGNHILTVDHEYDFAVISLATYFCSVSSPEIKLTEHTEYRWLEPAELYSVDWAPADIPTVDILVNEQ